LHLILHSIKNKQNEKQIVEILCARLKLLYWTPINNSYVAGCYYHSLF